MKKFLTTCIFIIVSTLMMKAQTSSINENDKTLWEVISIKKELTNSDKLKEFYKIQLYSGDLANAEKIKRNYDQLFQWSSTIKYQSPNYKLWIGNFRNRLEADRAMQEISQQFESAFIIKPGRS